MVAAVLLAGCHAWGDLLPDLVPVDLRVPSVIQAPPNPSLQVTWAVTNQGAGEAVGYWSDILYLSTRSTFDSSATFLAYQNAPTPMEPGDMYWNTNQVSLPIVQGGFYYIILEANAYRYLLESDPNNNELAAGFTFEPTPADLSPLGLVVASTVTGPPNPLVTVAWGVTNQGPGYASGYWSDTLYLSSQATLDSTAIPIASQGEQGPVPAGGRYWSTNTVRLPVVQSGTYYLLFNTDQNNSLYETETNNNLVAAAVTFNIQPPDLAPLGLLVPNVLTGAPNPIIRLVWGVTNQGAGPAIGNYSWDDRVYLSADTNLDSTDRVIVDSYEFGPIAPGGTYWRTNDNVVLPVVTNGQYYLIFQTDAPGSLYESDTNNNTLFVPITLTIQRPDLVPLTRFPSEITGPPFPSVTLVFGGTNQGIGPALGYWYDFVFFGTNEAAALQNSLFSFYQNGPVPPGATYWQTNTVRLPAVQDGTYYFVVESDFYSNLYESDRSNNLVSMPVTVHILPPDLSPIALQLPTVVTSPPNPQLTFVWGITNQGIGPAIGNSYWDDIIYFSKNSVWDNTAIILNSSYENGPVNAGDSYWRTNVLQVPVLQSGTYYFFLKVDAYSNLIESAEDNNDLAVAVDFIIQPPDLAPLVSQIPNTFTGAPNPYLTLTWGVTNQGTGLAKGYSWGWSDAVSSSTNGMLDSQNTGIGYWYSPGPLAPGASYWYTNRIWVPVTQSGTYYLIFQADQGNNVYESDESNNNAVVPITFTVLPPDLAPLALQVPPVLTGPPNPTVSVVWGVTNQGTGPAVDWSWSDSLYFSRNATLDASDVVIGSQSESGPVAPGGSYWRTNTVRVPVVSNTNCYLIFKTDVQNALLESNATNNTLAVPLKVNILPPDLAPVAFLAPNVVTSAPQPTLTFVWGVTNQGTGMADPGTYFNWRDRIYLATNNVLDNTAVYIGDWFESTPIPAGGSYWRTNNISLPVFQSGTYFLFFTTDDSRTIFESDFGNNTVSVPMTFTIQPADLAVIAFQAPPIITGPPKPPVTLVWGVTNQGIGAAMGTWSDTLYISSSPVFDYSATQVVGISEYGPLEPGGSYWRTNIETLPVTQSGKYYLFFQTDFGDRLYESDTSNNQVSLPVTVNILPPDLSPLALQVTNLVIGPPIPSVTFVWGVMNLGPGAAVPDWSWQDQFTLCPGPVPGPNCNSFASSTETGTIPAGESYWRTNTYRVPVVTSGTYFISLDVDVYAALFESTLTNNEVTVPITFQIQPPDLAPIVLQAPRFVTGGPYPQVKLSWGVTNQGTGSAVGNGYWSDRVYLSANPRIDPNAVIIASSYESGPVAPGANYWVSQTVRMPVAESGSYYLILDADADQVLYDGNYSNNTVAIPITFNIMPPDLAPIAFLAPTTISGLEVTNITFVWGVTNQGIGSTPSGVGWCDSVYFSTAPQGSWNDIFLFSTCGQDALPAGGSYWRTNTAPLPVTQSGNYYFILRTDSGSAVIESIETNNTMVVPVTVNVEPPDLAPFTIQVSNTISGPPNPNLNIVYAITNQGAGVAFSQNSWVDQVFLSRTNVLDATGTPVSWFYEQGPILPGDSYWRTNSVRVPAVQSGLYYLLLETDAYNSLQESDESNNVLAIPVTFGIQPSDVAAIGLQAPGVVSGPQYPQLTLSWGVTNEGPNEAVGGWGWVQAVYVSRVPVLDSNAVFISSFFDPRSLLPGGVEWFTNQVTLPITTNGQYYILVNVNANNGLHESNVGNDVVAVAISYVMEFPDLAPITLQAPNVLTVPPDPWVTIVWGVTNQGLGVATAEWPWYLWYDNLWVSTSSHLDTNAVPVIAVMETNSVAPGGSYWGTNTVQLPIARSGNYYLIFTANTWNSVMESDTNNNMVVVPLTVTVTPPDLKPFIFQVPSHVTGQPYPEITVVWGVTNQGPGPALLPYVAPGNYPWPLADALYVSSTPTLDDFWGLPAAVWPRTAPILPGTSYIQTNTVRLPVVNSGTYYVIFRTDAFQAVAESDESNNTATIPVTFQLSPPADLTALAFVAPQTISGPGNPVITLAWHVLNQGLGPAVGGWWDTITLYGPFPVGPPIGRFWISQPLLVGGDYWQTNSLILPITTSGDYQLTFQTGDGMFDLDLQDNWLTVPIHVDITGPATVRLSNPQPIPGGGFEMSVYAVLSNYYTLQGSVDLKNWSRVLDFVCTQNPMMLYDPEAAQYAWRFYRVAPLTNLPALRLDIGSTRPWTSNGLLLKLDGPVGRHYQIEASMDLVDWQQVVNLTPTVAPMYFVDPSAANFERRFYRAVLVGQ
jgi:subtilase family serine protease